jgi:hypothetical protein
LGWESVVKPNMERWDLKSGVEGREVKDTDEGDTV